MGKRVRDSVMVEGMCFRQNCFNKGRRCGTGYCGTCCYTFHNHGPNSIVAGNISGPRPGPTSTALVSTALVSTALVSTALVSTAIQPEPTTYTYEPGEIRLVYEQPLGQLRP